MPVAVALTISEATTLLDPPMDEAQLRAIIRALRWQPSGWRRPGKRGHPIATYDAAEIFKLHSAVAPWLVTGHD